MTMFQKQTLIQISLFLSMALCVPVYALGSTETNHIEAIFDHCTMSDSNGISQIFIEKNGKSHFFSGYSESEALNHFCNEDVANPSKKGKLFKLILTPMKKRSCAEVIGDTGECVQWLEEITLAVKSAQQIPNENKVPPAASPSDTETNHIEATFDDCMMSDADGISNIFVEKNGTSHSFGKSEAIEDFCNEDVANPSKKGKLFKLILTPMKTRSCAEVIGDTGECVQWVEEMTLAVKSAQQIPNENKVPPAASPSDTVDTDAIGCGCRTTHAPLNRAWAFFLLPMLVWVRRRLRV
jgi:hypothetical protein